MNVCFFCRGFSSNGGIGRVTSILANALVENDEINVFLCSYSDEKAESNYYISEKCNHEFLFPCRVTMTKALLQKHAVKKLSDYLRRNKIDIIIACGVMYYTLAVLAAKKCGIKVIGWEHTDPNNKRDYKFQDQNRAFGAKRTDCNVLLTKAALKTYNSRFPKANNVQLYNPVDDKLFEYKGSYDSDSKKIISVGRLRPQKNFNRLLDIAAAVLPEHPEWTWDIYGEGELRSSLEEKRDSLGLKDRISFPGQVGDLYDRYRNYSFIVMTSDYEGFPMTLLEGAANKLPMIAFDVPTGPNEIIKNGVNGYLCSHGSNEEMINAVEAMIANTEKRIQMSAESRKTAELFDVDTICGQWTELLKGMV